MPPNFEHDLQDEQISSSPNTSTGSIFPYESHQNEANLKLEPTLPQGLLPDSQRYPWANIFMERDRLWAEEIARLARLRETILGDKSLSGQERERRIRDQVQAQRNYAQANCLLYTTLAPYMDDQPFPNITPIEVLALADRGIQLENTQISGVPLRVIVPESDSKNNMALAFNVIKHALDSYRKYFRFFGEIRQPINVIFLNNKAIRRQVAPESNVILNIDEDLDSVFTAHHEMNHAIAYSLFGGYPHALHFLEGLTTLLDKNRYPMNSKSDTTYDPGYKDSIISNAEIDSLKVPFSHTQQLQQTEQHGAIQEDSDFEYLYRFGQKFAEAVVEYFEQSGLNKDQAILKYIEMYRISCLPDLEETTTQDSRGQQPQRWLVKGSLKVNGISEREITKETLRRVGIDPEGTVFRRIFANRLLDIKPELYTRTSLPN